MFPDQRIPIIESSQQFPNVKKKKQSFNNAVGPNAELPGVDEMRCFAVLLVSLSLAAVHGTGLAQDEHLVKDNLPKSKIETAVQHSGGKSVFDDPLGGVVVNRTVTVLGDDFYQYFSTYWREKDISSKFTISVHERPSARFGSEIWVQFRQKRMFHTFLPPARAATKKISAMAVDMVYRNIAESEVERMMVRSPDLGPEEM
jgi:curli production assembly/transport component CsgE